MRSVHSSCHPLKGNCPVAVLCIMLRVMRKRALCWVVRDVASHRRLAWNGNVWTCVAKPASAVFPQLRLAYVRSRTLLGASL